MEKIKLGAVSYLNTKPLLYGIEHSPVIEKIDIVEDHPANIAQMLLDDEIDIGLVPVAIIPRLQKHFIVSDYGIAANGPVASVCLFSEVPMDEIQTVMLDYQSRTSARLVQVLLQNYWNRPVDFIQADENYIEKIEGTTAGLVIGDRALLQRKVSTYVYDLGEAWKKYTGLPFVFAAWVANKPFTQEFIDEFNAANAYGLTHLKEVIADNPFNEFDLLNYYTENIHYHFTPEMKKGMERFLEEMNLQIPVE